LRHKKRTARVLLHLTRLLVLSACVAGASIWGQRPPPESARARMQRLLGLTPSKVAPQVEVLQQSVDGELVIEDIKFEAERGVKVPAIVVKPKAASRKLPVIICLPGTGGTRQQLTERACN